MAIERQYWDSCIFISWLQDEQRTRPEETQGIVEIVGQVQDQEANMITSVLTLAEVLDCELDDSGRLLLQQTLKRSNVNMVATDHRIWLLASEIRNYYQKHRGANKLRTLSVPDCVHLATAIKHEVDVLYTFDEETKSKKMRAMIPLSGDIAGHDLKIAKPIGKPNLFTGTGYDGRRK